MPDQDPAPDTPDLTALLFAANDAWRALEQGRCGIRRGVDLIAESKRLTEALEALEMFAESRDWRSQGARGSW